RVRVQEPVDHREEVKQSPFRECLADTDAAVPLAESPIIDVRMSNRAVRGRGGRLQGDNPIRLLTAEILPGKANLKTPQINSFQLDRLSGNAKLIILQVDGQLERFLLKRKKIQVDFARTRYTVSAENILQLPNQLIARAVQPFQSDNEFAGLDPRCG